MKALLGKSMKELIKMRSKLHKEVYENKLKNSIRALTQTHHIGLGKKNIARVNTAITQKTSESRLQTTEK